jgi:hypothetical protein
MPDFGNFSVQTPGALLVYFIPTFVASARNQENRFAIFALNLVLGWTVIGWIGALMWAIQKPAHV